jgi:hypothetical protein
MRTASLTMILSGCIQIHTTSTLTIAPSKQMNFDVQQARLMARFSYVAYEDPPSSMSMSNVSRSMDGKLAGSAAEMMPGIEQYIDNFGVAITRPRPKVNVNRGDTTATKNEQPTIWKMAHVDACSPRPLNLMLSECTPTTSSEEMNLNESSFQWIALASNKNTGAQFDAWGITTTRHDGKSENILVIAFRGTRLNTFVDLWTDIQLQQKMVSCSNFVCKFDDDDSNNDDDEIMVHSGFLKSYSSIRNTLLQLIADSSDFDRIWMTGHSLGGALASLAVVDVGSVMKLEAPVTVATLTGDVVPLFIPRIKLSSYVFGTPRVGNAALAKRLNRLQQTNQSETAEGAVVEEYLRG